MDKKRMGLGKKLLLIFAGFVALGLALQTVFRYAQDTETLTEAGKAVKAAHADWPNNVCNLVAKRQVIEGMTREQVQAAWGRPSRTSREEGAGSSLETWLYAWKDGSTRCVFGNDKVISLARTTIR